MPVVFFLKLRKKIINQFMDELNPNLYYHNHHHTLDVLKQSVKIAKKRRNSKSG